MITAELYSQTRRLHERVEIAVDMPKRFTSPESYLHLLQRLYGYYSSVEHLLRTQAVTLSCYASYSARRKTPWLVCDLKALGFTGSQIEELPCDPRLPGLRSEASWLGCVYVLEGATLGGQLIVREVQSRLGYTPLTGAAFFTGYGARTGEMWKRFQDVLVRFEQEYPSHTSEVINAACETFQTYEEWVAC